MKKYVALVLVIIIIFSCQKESPDMFEKAKINSFWKWFTANEKTFREVRKDDIEIALDKIINELNKIQNNLAVEISVKRNDGKYEMIISAEGDKEKFDIVTKITQLSPAISDWIITAFRQRANQAFSLKINDIELDTKKMYFKPIIDNNNLDLIIYGDGFSKVDQKVLFQYGLIVMDNLIGEYDSVMKVRYYDFKDLSEVLEMNQLMNLMELPQYLDNRK